LKKAFSAGCSLACLTQGETRLTQIPHLFENNDTPGCDCEYGVAQHTKHGQWDNDNQVVLSIYLVFAGIHFEYSTRT
jgi:hypothetical protein